MAIYQINETIKFMRENLGMTQEELSDGICSTETLSRIETGKRTPNRTTYKKLMGKMGKSSEKYLSYIRSEDIHVHLEKEKMDTFMKTYNYEELDRILPEFEKKLDMDDMINKQYVLRLHAMTDYRLNRIDIKKQQDQLITALRYTIPSYQEGTVPRKIFTRQELILLCNIAVSYFENQELETALSMLFELENYFQTVHVDTQERAVSEVLMLSNLSQCLGRIGNIEEAEKRIKKAIMLSINGNVCGSLPNLLYNLAFANEISQKNKSLCKEQFIQAYYIAEICKNSSRITHIKQHIKNVYGDNFIDFN